MRSLAARLEGVAQRQPGRPAVVEPDGIISYEALLAQVEALSAGLAAAGVGRGKRVAIAYPNGAGFVRAFFAVVRLGAAAVPLNPAYTAQEMAALIGDAAPTRVLAAADLAGRCREAVTGLLPVEAVWAGADLPSASGTTVPDLGTPEDEALCLYSSGSTGRPKRIARTQGMLVWEAERLAAALGLSPEDRVLGAAPFSHVNGLMRSMVAGLLAGAALVPVAQFERRAAGRLIQSQRLTVFIGVPFMFAMLAETRWPSTPDFGSLRWCFSSSAPLKPDTARGFRERYGIPVRQLYGTTETGTIALNLDADPVPTGDSVGHPLPGVSVEVFGEDGEPVPPGAGGDIGIRSPAATREYPGLPGPSAEAFRGGYFFPGDVGRKDEGGRVYLMGRKSLFINRGGFKVNPYEVEQVLEQHPGVREAAVVGDETEYGDQRVRAVVVTAGPVDEDALVEFCRQRMADFKVPSLIEFRPELPKSTAGKILRKVL